MGKRALALPAVANQPLTVDVAAHMVVDLLWNYLGLTAAALMGNLALALPVVVAALVAAAVDKHHITNLLHHPLHSIQVHYHIQAWKLL